MNELSAVAQGESVVGATAARDRATAPEVSDEHVATLWRGFHHAWEYNHRLNRLGSYVDAGEDGEPIVGHTAASGTGGDVAHFSEFVTRVTSSDAGFQTGWAEGRVECPRDVATAFRIRVEDLALDPALVGRDRYAVVLNGFDLYAEQYADKLIAFDLEVTDPVVYANGTKMRFDILGSMHYDCRTAECQLWPVAMEVEEVKKAPEAAADVEGAGPPVPEKKRGIAKPVVIEQIIHWAKQQIAKLTDLETLKQGMLGREEDRSRRRLFRLLGRRVFLRMQKSRIVTPYRLRVAYAVVAGDRDTLSVTESDVVENAYTWDTVTEIDTETLGRCSITVEGEPPERYSVNTFGFKQFSVETALNQAVEASNPIQWGTGMHLLELDAAVREIKAQEGKVTAELDLFFKSWSEAMNEVITMTTWGALRSAGSARLTARLALLQFGAGAVSEDIDVPGESFWPGGGLKSGSHPLASSRRPVGHLEKDDVR